MSNFELPTNKYDPLVPPAQLSKEVMIRNGFQERSPVIGNHVGSRKKTQRQYSLKYDGDAFNGEDYQKVFQKYPTFFGLMPDESSIGLCEYADQYALLVTSRNKAYRDMVYNTMVNFGASKREAPKCPYFYKEFNSDECFYTGVTFKNFFNTFVFFFSTMIEAELMKNPKNIEYVYALEKDMKIEYEDENGAVQSFIDDRKRYVTDIILKVSKKEIENEAQLLSDLFFNKLPKKKLSLRPRTIYYEEAGVPNAVSNRAFLMAA